MASTLPPPGRLQVPNSVGGRLLGTGARLIGGFSDTVADELARQRLDPLSRQYAIAQGILDQANRPPDMGPAPGVTQPISAYSAANQPIRETAVTGQPQMPPPPPNPLIGLTPEKLVAAKLFPTIEESISPSKQAEIRSKEAETAYRAGPLTEHTRSNIAENQQQVRSREEQDARDREFTAQYNAAVKNNPTGTMEERAALAGEIAARTGASDKVTKPIMDAFGTAGTLNYHNRSIEVQRARIAQDRDQFRQSLDKGDVNAARQIVASELSDINNLIKTEQRAVATAQKIIAEGQEDLADPVTKLDSAAVRDIQASMAQARATLTTAKESLQQLAGERADAQRRLKSLFAGTKAGKEALSREPAAPPPPPPGAAAPRTPQQQPRTLDEYRRMRGY